VNRVGTAGWSIPSAHTALFPAEGSHLARYCARFNAVEINSSFYRPHRASTYARWAASVPSSFRFSVKLPRAITHDAKLVDAEPLLRNFAAEISYLGDRLGPVLVQLPPKLAFDPAIAGRFFDTACSVLPGRLVCEPRHASWFTDPAQALLAEHGVAGVAADPARVDAAARPSASRDLFYLRLHGSPRIYYSGYGEDRMTAWRDLMMSAPSAEKWCILDNTALGEAVADAATLSRLLAAG
jgi:uncharacterized protein YecE (DUF72 family)